MQIKDITNFLESWAPPSLQESYDNSGLLVGSPQQEITKALISLDVTEEVMQEAIDNQCQLVIAHHPVIFGNLKRLNGNTMTERIVMMAIKNDIGLYAIHTNLDNVYSGVNAKVCERIGIKNPKILESKKGLLRKLVTFCPDTLMENDKPMHHVVLEALWEVGAGSIGNYDQCSFYSNGKGTFRPKEGTNPYIGAHGERSLQNEIRIELIFPVYRQKEIIERLLEVHPYEEVAYDVFALENALQNTGSGMIGELEHEMDEMEFLFHLKKVMQTSCVRYSPLSLGRGPSERGIRAETGGEAKKVKKVAVCGGSGSFLLKNAIAKGADVFVTADYKYHQFFDAEGRILIADIGHYESEQFTIGLIFDKLKEKMPNFALLKSRVNTNPVNYI